MDSGVDYTLIPMIYMPLASYLSKEQMYRCNKPCNILTNKTNNVPFVQYFVYMVTVMHRKPSFQGYNTLAFWKILEILRILKTCKVKKSGSSI